MFKSSLLKSVPVNLIQQPLERAAVIVCLIAFAQFVTYLPGASITPALSWFLTAPVLMMAAILIAIRSQNSTPLLITFISGAIAVICFFNPDIPSLLSVLKTMIPVFLGDGFSGNNSLGMNPNEVHKSLMSLSLYAIAFWLIISRFFQSRLFSWLQSLVAFDNTEAELVHKFEVFIFITVFITLNTSVVFSLVQPDDYSLISLGMATLFLFVCGQHLSDGKRGLFLPVYITLLLASYLLIHPDENSAVSQGSVNSDVLVFVVWSFMLWFGHNFASQTYNRVFTKIKITTTLWPVFGLLIIMAFLFDASLHLIFQPVYLMILITYLFLMLRNTSQSLIAWTIILFLSWLLLVVEFTVNNGFFHNSLTWNANLSGFGRYGQQSILYCFSLILFSVVWDRFINQIFVRFGWYQISFQKPVLTVSIVVTILWFTINMLLVAGLLTDWFDRIDESLAIEKTTALVIVSFIILSLFINNQILANLIHASLIFGMIVLWGISGEGLFAESQSIPVYSLFAVIHLSWVLLPLLIQFVCDKLNLSYPENFINSSANWVYISFIVTLICLLNFADNHLLGLESASFLSSLVILFVASLVLVRRYTSDIWIIFCYLLATGMILSLRFMILGDVPVNVYDTTGILIITFILFSLTQWNLLPLLSLKSKPDSDIRSAMLVKVLPLTALLTIPWQTASLHSSLTLFILGVFYLLIKKDSRNLFYTGLFFINLAVYTWMPLLSVQTNLMLFYMLPVSMSLLLITHLHKNEMKPELQNKIRFIALSLLYLLAAADIFISSSLLLFFIGLLSGLLSAIYGISSKTRAFLYTGIGFMIVNILGQLIVFYPDDRLGRALILMATGAVITGLMVWFNIKREFLLAKIQLFRSDLELWD